MAIPTKNDDKNAPPRWRSRMTRSGRIGFVARNSVTTNALNDTAAPANRATVPAAPHPSVPAVVNP
jgi:hypothetical protein